ncbi:signal recognition particle-docking protein FtsY [Candidatus Woesearchaeota archaeon]|nr:MAG: signal recognition particle-docking protein FtsY [Candidatus Woesearchaeota archaeon]
MFKFLKEKIKSAVASFSKKAEEAEELRKEDIEEAETEVKEEKPEQIKEEKKPKKEEKAKEKTKKEEAPQGKKEKAEEKPKGGSIEEPKAEEKNSEEAPQAEKEEMKTEASKKESHEREAAPAKEEINEKFEKKEEKAEKKKEDSEKEKQKKFLGIFKRKERKEKKEDLKEEKEEKLAEKVEKSEDNKEKAEKEKKGFLKKLRIIKKSLSEEKFEKLFWDFELALLENNVAVEAIEKIKSDLKAELVDSDSIKGNIEDIILETLRKSISELFATEKISLLDFIRKKKPFVILFVGVNGSGKTTTLAKITKFLQDNNFSCVIAACDTFRAAAIQQLEEHASKLGVKVIKHDYGSDAAAVAFDAIKHAESRNKDVVLIDSAGRSHSNSNLMEELKKLVRVAKPDLTIFVGDSLTGNDMIEQAKSFNEEIGFDAIVLSKADIDEKGGAAISISYVTKKPILYLGVGQGYEDLKEFDKAVVMESLGLT